LLSARLNLTGPLEFIAEQLSVKLKSLLASNFYFIYPHIVVFAKSTAEHKKALTFFENLSRLQAKQVFLYEATSHYIYKVGLKYWLTTILDRR
jgi:hypothetical protein